MWTFIDNPGSFNLYNDDLEKTKVSTFGACILVEPILAEPIHHFNYM
jgi:hypothetical protein